MAGAKPFWRFKRIVCKEAFSGELVLQDTPAVINTLQSNDIPGIKPMVYDIFTPQLIMGKYLTRN